MTVTFSDMSGSQSLYTKLLLTASWLKTGQVPGGKPDIQRGVTDLRSHS